MQVKFIIYCTECNVKISAVIFQSKLIFKGGTLTRNAGACL